jgi:hypothetical protein
MPLFCCFNTKPRACNAHCKVCKKSGQTPNILGKFVIIENDSEKVICTGCKNVFTKEECAEFLK